MKTYENCNPLEHPKYMKKPTPEQITRRNELMKPLTDDIPVRYDIIYFNGMNSLTLQILVNEKFADPEECQNDAPPIKEYLRFITANPKYRVHGYIVSPDREDYRISIEGMCGEELTVDEILIGIDFERRADELDYDSKTGTFRSWWD